MIQKAVKDQKGPLRMTIMCHIWRYAINCNITWICSQGSFTSWSTVWKACIPASPWYSTLVCELQATPLQGTSQFKQAVHQVLYMNSSCLKDFKHFSTAFEHLSRIGPYPNAVHRLNGAGNRPLHVLPHQNLNSCGCSNLTAFSGEN